MNITLPDPIDIFFKVSNGADASALTRCFSDTAIVHDEGNTHQGCEAIQSWLREAQRKFAFRVEPLSALRNGAHVHVLTELTGRFPGSPVRLEHVFHLSGDTIESLEIR